MKAGKKPHINQEITAKEVRLVGAEGEQIGIIETTAALEKAKAENLDLVEISPKSTPPVCKVMDFGKYLFELSKKRTAQRKKQKQVHVKEIKLRPSTDVGDYLIKLRKIKDFLANGDKVKVTVRFRGREMQHRDLGMNLMHRIEKDLEEDGVVEQQAKLEGWQMVMVIAAKKK